MSKPLISIIIPAYNIEKYIERCIQSVINQTYENLEIIIINDGSTDNTAMIINKYSLLDKRIVPIHKENGGVSTARSAGLKIAKGEYIGFVDGDDYIEAEMFESLMNNMMKYKADISHCGYKMIFPDEREDLYYGTGKLVIQTQEDGLKDLLRGDFVEPGLWNKLYHRSIVEGYDKSNLWDDDVKINEDLLMNYIFFKKAKQSVYEDVTFYHYMLRLGSATSNFYIYKLLDPKKVIEYILGDIDKETMLYPIVIERYLRVLLNISKQKIWKKEAKSAQKLLRRNVLEFRQLKNVSKKVCIMSGVAGFFPVIYRLIRCIYEKVTGVEDKYKIE